MERSAEGSQRRTKFDPNEYQLRKRRPAQPPRRENDIYVNTSTNFKAQLARCRKLIDSGQQEIFVHAMGAAVSRAINMALQIETQFQGLVELDVRTSTEELVDDLEPQTDDLEPQMQRRQTSAVHIRIFMPAAQPTST